MQCKTCGAWTVVQPGPCTCEAQHPGLCSGQFHEALDATKTCHCCPEDHNHRLSTIETGIACRPVTIAAMAGIAPLEGFGL